MVYVFNKAESGFGGPGPFLSTTMLKGTINADWDFVSNCSMCKFCPLFDSTSFFVKMKLRVTMRQKAYTSYM